MDSCSPCVFLLFDSIFTISIPLSSIFSTTQKTCALRGSFFMFVESGCISTNIEFKVP